MDQTKPKTEFDFCDCEFIHEDIVREVKNRVYARDQYESLADLMKMFADATRVRILHTLEQHEMCVCDLAALLGITKSAASHQLKTLRMANLVRSRRVGQIVFYALADDHVKELIDVGFEHLRENE